MDSDLAWVYGKSSIDIKLTLSSAL